MLYEYTCLKHVITLIQLSKHVCPRNRSPNQLVFLTEPQGSLLVFNRGFGCIDVMTYVSDKNKLLLGFTQPVKNEEEISLFFAANFQYQYQQFQNISELSQYYFIKTVSREERELDLLARRNERLVFYRAAAEMMKAKGMNGLECMLRAICEAAQFPVENEGFVGEIMHVILTPDYGQTDFDDEELEDLSIYKDAAIAGRQMFSCPHVYKDCPSGNGVMELISKLSDE